MSRIPLRPLLEPAAGLLFLGGWAWVIDRLDARDSLVHLPSVELGLIGSIVLLAAAIGMARIRPITALIVIAALVASQLIFAIVRPIDDRIYLAVPIVAFIVAAHSRGTTRRFAPIALAVIATAMTALLAIPLLSTDGMGWTSADYQVYLDAFQSLPPGDWTSPADVTQVYLLVFAVVVVGLGIGWLVGVGYRAWLLQRYGDRALVRTRKELRAAEVALHVGRERDRISQDVHDIMAHSLSVIIAQANGARYAGSARPDIAAESLSNISDTARSSLTEVRRLIESLGPDPEPHHSPDLDDVADLLERMRTAGLAITFTRFGDDRVTDGRISTVAFRLLQESLTNALKHAGDDARAQVTAAWHEAGLTLTVVSQGTGRPGSVSLDTGGAGRGIPGMRERAQELGGWLTAESDDADPLRFIVTAFLPAVPVVATVSGHGARRREEAMQ